MWEDKFCALTLPCQRRRRGAFLRRGETEREEEDRLFIKAVNPRMEKSMRMCRMEKLFSSKGFEKVV